MKVGEKVKDEKNQIVFDGNTEISGDASLSAKTLTLSGKTLTVQANTLDDTASLTAEATTVDAAGSKIAVNGYAAANLGAITIADASTAAGLTLTVDSTASLPPSPLLSRLQVQIRLPMPAPLPSPASLASKPLTMPLAVRSQLVIPVKSVRSR